MTSRWTHAAAGAWTLSMPSSGTEARIDARRSIELVGTHTAAVLGIAPDPVGADDPVTAARAWIQRARARGTWNDDVLDRVERTLDLAEAHLQQVDVLAGQLAADANETGTVDRGRLQQVDHMAEVLRTWSQRLRSMLDDSTHDADGVTARLDAGLAAAERGGLPALVAAL